MNEESKNELIVSVLDIEELSPDVYSNITRLYLFDPQKGTISQHVINDDRIAREGPYSQALLALKKFKNLKELYFLNVIMTNIPEGVLSVKKLELLQFCFLNHFIPEYQIPKLLRLKKLKKLIINGSFIGERDFNVIKNGLPKVEVLED
jgi:hypothetical protein